MHSMVRMAHREPPRADRRRICAQRGRRGRTRCERQSRALQIQAGEKFPQNYRLEVTNPGGHSSRPTKDNAIYHLAAALTRIQAYDFPAQFTDGSRAYFRAWQSYSKARGTRKRRPP